MVMLRGFVFFMFGRGLSVMALPVLLLWVLHLLIYGLALIRVGVRGGGHRGDWVRGRRLTFSGENLSHHLNVDGFIVTVSLDLRVGPLERQGCRHTWGNGIEGQLGARAPLGF